LAASFNCHFAGFPWRRRFSFAAAWFAQREEANQLRKDGSSLCADDLYALTSTIDDAARAWRPLILGRHRRPLK
jgi:hypothetical protein